MFWTNDHFTGCLRPLLVVARKRALSFLMQDQVIFKIHVFCNYILEVWSLKERELALLASLTVIHGRGPLWFWEGFFICIWFHNFFLHPRNLSIAPKALNIVVFFRLLKFRLFSFTLRKNCVLVRNVHWKVPWGTQNGSKNNTKTSFWNVYF